MIEIEIELDGLRVVVGMPATRDIPALTVKSLVTSATLCHNNGVNYGLAMVVGNAVVQWARDEIVKSFLESSANRLFLIDSDIVWEPDDFMRLVALSKHFKVVCGAYTTKNDSQSFIIYHDEEKGLTEQNDFGLIEILGTGLGFTIIDREVIEKLVEKADSIYDEITKSHIPSIFKVGTDSNGKRRGEDISFFEDIRNLGYKIYLDPRVQLGHMGMKLYSGNVFNAIQNTSKEK